VVSWYTNDAVYEDTTIKHTSSGVAEIRRFAADSFTKVPGHALESVSGFDAGSSFSTEWVMKPMGLRGVSIGSLREGKFATQRDYWDARTLDL
jgi:hypothetical protein